MQSLKLNSNGDEDLTDLHLSVTWQEYDDFPSSEDLSAFLADLEKDAFNGDDRQPLQALNSGKPESPLRSLYPDATFGEVVNECYLPNSSRTRDYTEFTDFPSSEDLEVFLADMELDHGSMLIQKPLTPNITMVSTAQRDAIVSSRANYSPWNDITYNSEGSDSQFLRDCETVFAEVTGDNNTESIRVESKAVCLLPKSLIPYGARDENRTNAEEIGEYDSRANQTNDEKCTSIEHCSYSDMSVLNDSCDILSTASMTPDLFTQLLCSSERASGTPDLFTRPRRQDVKFHSRCAHHNMTPNSFSSEESFRDCTDSCSIHELNSMSLFSSSDSSFISPASSPLRRTGPGASCLSSAHGTEAASLPNPGQADTGNEFDTDSVATSFHSTPYTICSHSKLLRKSLTPLQMSPFPSNSGLKSCRDNSCQGTPVLFSQISNDSL